MTQRTKVSIIGAGAVGTSTAYALLIKKIAGEIALFDVNQAKVEAEVLDLAHGSQFTNPSRIYGGNDIEVVRNSDVIVITAGAKQEPGQTRLDLAATNIKILNGLMPNLVRLAPEAIFLLVTNPCDVLAYAAVQISGLPANRVFSSGTVLDSSRLRWQLAEKVGVSTESVHAMIVGEHGDSEFPLWSEATMPDQLSKEVVQDRYERLLAVANEVALQENQKLIGKVVEVLVANIGRKDDATGRLTGRARDNRLVHFNVPEGVRAPRPGDIVTVTVTDAAPYHLLADTKSADDISVRRTSGGDASERLGEEAETKRIALSISPAK